MSNQSQKLAILIFELGDLQVYHYQDITSWTNKVPAVEFFWHRKGDPRQHGPFTSIHDAVDNYKGVIVEEKHPTPLNLIKVDFKNKKKIPSSII